MGFFIGPSACSLYRFEQINGDSHFDHDFRGMSAVAVMTAIAGIAIPSPYVPTCLHAYMPTCLHAYMPTCLHAYSTSWTNVNLSRKLVSPPASPSSPKSLALVAVNMT